MRQRIHKACRETLASCGLKRCSKCKSVQALSSFHKRTKSVDGLDPVCRSCRKEYNREFRERRPEYYSEWTEQNPEYLAQWRKSEQGRASASKARRRRRAMKAAVDENFGAADEAFVRRRDNNTCQSCGMTEAEHQERWGQSLHLDHIRPLSKGYALTRDNCQLLCRKCNSRKSNKLPGA